MLWKLQRPVCEDRKLHGERKRAVAAGNSSARKYGKVRRGGGWDWRRSPPAEVPLPGNERPGPEREKEKERRGSLTGD